jgi:hypothetical protein
MNALFARAPQHASAALPPTTSTITIDTATDRPLGLLDRLSLRLGLWLLTRHAARGRTLEHRADRAHRRHAADAERAARERAWHRTAALIRPPL